MQTVKERDAMRKGLETISLAGLGLQIWTYCWNMYGPDRLPARVPVHFDLAGNPNRWDSPSSFVFIPIIGAALYLFLTLIARAPLMFNYPVTVTEENRARLQALAIDLIAWIKMELVGTFTLTLWTCFRLARHPALASHVLYLFVPVVVIFATVAWFIVSMMRPVRAQLAH